MLKTKQKRFAIVAILVFSMIAMYGGVPVVSAASMDSAKTTLGDSDLLATNTITIDFDLGTALTGTDYVNVSFPAQFTNVDSANVTCPDGGTEAAGLGGNDVKCTGALASTTVKQITITGVTNPGTPGDYTITVSTHDSGDVEIESTDTKVYIINDVTMSATVAASLTFEVHGTSTAATVNGETTTGSSSATSIVFGQIDSGPGNAKIMGQQLKVSTNATGGFSVSVQQDGNMLNGGGADINEFASSSPTAWASPDGTLDQDWTYGHMGVATDDSDLGFADGSYQGLDGTNPLEVFSHDGPADGTTVDKGTANVAYKIEISDLQEAGDYENTLTYVCTPTF